ncbi:MAG: hypothetical protein IAG13_09085 [Deltaproteobacteria bacterium]|nr:hypothetical protein [Nannocystaceae bacterium]
MAALRMWLRAVVYSAGVAGFSFDTEQIRRALGWLQPVTKSTRPDISNAVRFVENLLAFNLGRIHTVRHTGTDELAALLDNAAGEYPLAERRLIMGGVIFQRGLAAVRSGTPDALAEIAALERLDTRLWNNGALQLRSHYHMWRGEHDEAQRVWSEAELEFVRLGSQWQLEAVHHASACATAAYACDVLALKRHIEALARQVAAGLNYRAHLDVARGEHARLRGDLDTALAAIDAGLAQLPADEGLIRPWALTARADVLIGLGDAKTARGVAEAALAICEDPEHGQASFLLRAIRTVALCESALGEHELAAARIDHAIEAWDHLVNPLLLGSLHETRAQIALAAGDIGAAAAAAAQVEFWFRPTRNPVLVARWERLERALHPAADPELEVSANDVVTEMFDDETVHHDTLAVGHVDADAVSGSDR